MDGTTLNISINEETTKAIRDQSRRLGLNPTTYARMILTTTVAKKEAQAAAPKAKKAKKAS